MQLRHLLLYISHKYTSGYAYMSVRSSISALAFIQNFIQAPDITKNFMVVKALNGFKRLKPSKDVRSPVTLELLQKLIQTVSVIVPDSFMAALLKAMYSLAFFAFLRIGEMTGSHQTNHQLQLHAITVNQKDNTMTVTFETYKHKQDANPFRLRLHNTCSTVPVVTLMCQYLKRRGFRPGPLFILQNGRAIERKVFSDHLKRNVTLCSSGQIVNIRPHSFRIGAATHAIEIGYSEDQVRVMGRWRSQAFRNYVRIPVLSFK